MSDGPFTAPGSHPDDEQLSLVVDGLGDPETLAHLEHCLECGARLARWRQVRDLVAVPPATASGDQRDAAISAALEVFDDRLEHPGPAEGKGPADATAPANVIGLATVRRPRAREWRPVAAVAAAVLLIAALAFGISRLGHYHSSATASRSSSAFKAPATGGSSSQTQPAPATAAGAPAVALGSFPDMAAVRAALRSRIAALPGGPLNSSSAFASGSASAPTTTSGPASASAEPRAPRCQAAASRAAGAAPGAAPEFSATLTYAGSPAVVYVYQAPASHLAVVLSDASCRVLAQGSF